MNARNASRELRRAIAKRNAIANQIAEWYAATRSGDELALDWQLATMRVYALQKNLRPRECGAALGEGKTNGTHIPAVENPGNSAPDNAAPNPATSHQPHNPDTNHERNPKPEPMRRLPRPIPMQQSRRRLPHAGTVGGGPR